MCKHYAEDMAEAMAIIEYLESLDNYSGSISAHNLLVSWRDEELSWLFIEDRAEEIREENGWV